MLLPLAAHARWIVGVLAVGAIAGVVVRPRGLPEWCWPVAAALVLVALGLLPAALSRGVGSDTQRPFALVIVGGLFSRLLISVYLMPVLYAMFARQDDHLEV